MNYLPYIKMAVDNEPQAGKFWLGSFPALHQKNPADHDLFYSS
ncbi:MAG: hypothetical protein ACOYOE_10060 [Chlorobium sp.]